MQDFANNDDVDDVEEEFDDNETSYNGTVTPVQIENIDHSKGPAVILGALRYDGHIITADSMGVLVVQTAPD